MLNQQSATKFDMNFNQILISTCLLVIATCTPAYANEFELKHADSLEASKEEYQISGDILINYDGATIQAPYGTVQTSQEGSPKRAIFTGRVQIKMDDRTLAADKVTILIDKQTIFAEGNTISNLVDKEGKEITISSDYQELHWSGENAKAKGNLKTTYEDTEVTSDEALILYKNKKPNEAIFYGTNSKVKIEQPNHHTTANSITFNLENRNIHASGDVDNVSWVDDTKSKTEQDPVILNTEDLTIKNKEGKIIANGPNKKVKLVYQDTTGESLRALLFKNQETKKPEKIIFEGKAKVSQSDKELISEQVIFNFEDKKLTSNTVVNKRPKTLIYKTRENY